MKITVFGIGYVGLVQGAVLAEVGHDVLCVDNNLEKVEGLKKGVIPIYEPELGPMVLRNHARKRLNFTTHPEEAVTHGEVIFIAVGTPPGEDGSADLKYVKEVAKTIATYMNNSKIIVNKSTVPVGTAEQVKDVIEKELEKVGKKISFEVVSNPEFLKEGSAVSDCMKPDRIVIGAMREEVFRKMRVVYAPFLIERDCIIEMDIRSAELTKYAANCMLATKISFINEIANLAELLGADIEDVRRGIGADVRIGYHFINPGCGYGGSCFPKDVQALIRTSESKSYVPEILKAVEAVNYRQKEKINQFIYDHYEGNLEGKTFALWGLAFKPDTDDMREAPSRVIMEYLWSQGARVQAYDPGAMEEAKEIYGSHSQLTLNSTKEETLLDADALIICTEWKEFRGASLVGIKKLLKEAVIFDGRNICNLNKIKELQFCYYGVGRRHGNS